MSDIQPSLVKYAAAGYAVVQLLQQAAPMCRRAHTARSGSGPGVAVRLSESVTDGATYHQQPMNISIYTAGTSNVLHYSTFGVVTSTPAVGMGTEATTVKHDRHPIPIISLN
eukprot:m.113932 g.113932  ORF g.113932 m.113932 type:complete len:112 (+) comp21498_c0_seq2:1572-1907(+)